MLTSAAGDIGFKLHKILNGSIIVLALLTVLEGSALTEWSAMATIFMTLGANAAAEAFSRGVAHEIASKRRVSFSEAAALLRYSLIVVTPGIVPAVAFIAVSAGWLPLGKAFAAACWFLVFVLFAAGYIACMVGGGRVWRGLIYGAVISAFGLGIVALRLMTV
ncbi:MAG: hypothetical protein Q8Q81_13930 [Oxalobacteraceae bacterium]|nr:hypothetical protein [Oxalobacteraceae bacterium]